MLQYKRPGATSMFIEYSAISQILDAALRTISPRSLLWKWMQNMVMLLRQGEVSSMECVTGSVITGSLSRIGHLKLVMSPLHCLRVQLLLQHFLISEKDLDYWQCWPTPIKMFRCQFFFETIHKKNLYSKHFFQNIIPSWKIPVTCLSLIKWSSSIF